VPREASDRRNEDRPYGGFNKAEVHLVILPTCPAQSSIQMETSPVPFPAFAFQAD
jgi:hypothetical protein